MHIMKNPALRCITSVSHTNYYGLSQQLQAEEEFFMHVFLP